MTLHNLADQHVTFDGVLDENLPAIRRWVKKNKASIEITARHKGEGRVDGKITIHSPWDEPIQVARDKADTLRVLLSMARTLGGGA